MMTLVRVNEADFEAQVMRSDVPVLVDLFADWCEPCKQLLPVLEGMADEYAGRLKIVQIDVEANPILARSFGVQSIPMLVLIDGGRPVDHVVGKVDKQQLVDLVSQVLGAPAGAPQPMDPKALAPGLAQGQVVPIDIREPQAFARYRIPGAINIPVSALEDRKTELAPSDGRLRVLYARTTDDAETAAKSLAETGLQIAFLTGGFLHWEADGFEVERG